MSTYLIPRAWLDNREAEFSVVGVHGLNLFLGGSTQNLDDFDELINSIFTWEDGLSEHEFSHHTAYNKRRSYL